MLFPRTDAKTTQELSPSQLSRFEQYCDAIIRRAYDSTDDIDWANHIRFLAWINTTTASNDEATGDAATNVSLLDELRVLATLGYDVQALESALSADHQKLMTIANLLVGPLGSTHTSTETAAGALSKNETGSDTDESIPARTEHVLLPMERALLMQDILVGAPSSVLLSGAARLTRQRTRTQKHFPGLFCTAS